MIKNPEVDDKIYFVYLRVSSPGKYDMSLDDQEKIIMELVKKNNHKYKIIREQASSKETNERQEFDTMINELFEDSKLDKEKQKYGGIYIFKLDRFARNSQDFNYGEQLLDLGYKIISATETIENTPTGRLLFRMLSSFAIYESEKLSNRQSLSHIQNIIRNNLKGLGGVVIFGYYFDDSGNKNAKSQDKKLKINKEQSLIIIKIYDLYIDFSNETSKNYISDLNARYRKIWFELSLSDRRVLRKHCLKDSIINDSNFEKLYKNEENLIRNIINNKSNIKYNGEYYHEINVNDELIINYISGLEDNNTNDFTYNGINEVGGSITFKFTFPELIIVDFDKYNSVNRVKKVYKNGKSSNGDSSTGKSLIGKYSGILYYKTYLGSLFEMEAYTVIGKKAIQYRKISQRGTNDDKIFTSQNIFDNLFFRHPILKKLKFNKEQLSYIKDLSIQSSKEEFNKRNKSLNIKKIVFERMVNNYMLLLQEGDLNNDTFKILKNELNYYNECLDDINNKISQLNNFLAEQLEVFYMIFSDNKSLFVGTDKQINTKLKVLIDKIIINHDKEIESIELSLFVKELLGMKY